MSRPEKGGFFHWWPPRQAAVCSGSREGKMRLYDLDFYSWTRETADNLRRADFDSIDAAAVADEIEDTGRRERRALERRVAVLMRTC